MASSTRVAISTEAGSAIGMGHLARECDLAQQLQNEGIEVLLLVRGDRGLNKFIVERCDVPTEFMSGEDVLSDEEYFQRLESFGADAIVLDLLHREQDKEFLLRHKSANNKIVTVSDGEPPRVVTSDIDIRINPNHLGDAGSGEFRQHIYQGLSYFICNKHVWQARDEKRSYASVVNRVLLLYGGVDFAAGVSLALDGLSYVQEQLEIHLVLTPILDSAEQFREHSATRHHRVVFHSRLSSADLVDEMRRADLQIGNASNTAYEACVLGTPQITVNMVQRQNYNGAALAALGASVNLGMWADVCPQALALAVMTLSKDGEWRARLGQRGMQVVDGKGLLRVARIIKELL